MPDSACTLPSLAREGSALCIERHPIFLPYRLREGWPQAGVGICTTQPVVLQSPPRSGKPDLPLPQAGGEKPFLQPLDLARGLIKYLGNAVLEFRIDIAIGQSVRHCGHQVAHGSADLRATSALFALCACIR